MATAGVACVLWLATHRYEGIWHDAIVYSLIIARQLHPEFFARELFFAFGSQGDFSLYAPIAAHLVDALGLDHASRVVTLVGGMLWCAAFWALGTAVFGGSPAMRFLVLCGAVAGFSYSPNLGTFVLNENFATARVVAMPMALLGFAADLGGRPVRGAVIMLLALALHPLLGIWAVIVAVLRRLPLYITFSLLLSGTLLVLGVGLASPVRALLPMDPEWVDLVRYSSRDVFLGRWSDLQFGWACLWIVALALAASAGISRFRRLYASCGLVFVFAYALSAVCSYFLPLQLVMQIQPWRAMWIAVVLGLVATIDLSRKLWEISAGGRAAVVAGLLVALSSPVAAIGVLCCATAALHDGRRAHAMAWLEAAPGTARIFRWGLLPLALVPLATNYLTDLQLWGSALDNSDSVVVQALSGFLLAGGGGLGLLLLSFWIERRVPRRILLTLLLPTLVIAWEGWDRRTESTRHLEAFFLPKHPRSHVLAEHVASGDVIAWPRHELDIWLSLGAASYASGEQAIGIVFSRARAIEVRRRLERLAVASVMDGGGDAPEAILARFKENMATAGKDVRNLHAYGISRLTPAGVSFLCADPVLDWVVADVPDDTAEPPVSLVLTFLDAGQPRGLYRCRNLR